MIITKKGSTADSCLRQPQSLQEYNALMVAALEQNNRLKAVIARHNTMLDGMNMTIDACNEMNKQLDLVAAGMKRWKAYRNG